MPEPRSLQAVPDDALLRRLSELTHESRRVEVDLVAHIGEADARRLYAREACSSMFDYCRQVLGLRENEAYLRITVARASREHPVLLAMLRDGRLHLSGIATLARHLTRENRDVLLGRAAGLSHRQIKELSRELEPLPDAPPLIRKLPEHRGSGLPAGVGELGAHRVDLAAWVDSSASLAAPVTAPAAALTAVSLATPGAAPPAAFAVDPPATSAPPATPAPGRPVSLAGAPAASRPFASPSRPATAEPTAPGRYRVSFTADAELRGKLERLQDLMRSSVPDGDLAKLIDIAVTEKLRRLEAKCFARTDAPRKRLGDADTTPRSRHVPAPVRRAVYERDEGQCSFVDARGNRCQARSRLEFHHHEVPFGRGGDHSLQNVRLTCRTHNQLLAERDYGRSKMARYRRPTDRASEPKPAWPSRNAAAWRPPLDGP